MQAEQLRDRKITRKQNAVLDALLRARRPLSAYQLIRDLKSDGITWAPPTVYRALKCLIEHGLVHRVETLNAFVACGHSHMPHRNLSDTPDLIAFALCRLCGSAVEFEHPQISTGVSIWTEGSGFYVESAAIELRGYCKDCRSATN